jgi:hypothetical protein
MKKYSSFCPFILPIVAYLSLLLELMVLTLPVITPSVPDLGNGIAKW